MKYKSQTEAVLAHLEKHRSITSYEAFSLYGVTRLSAKIYSLRHNGYRIITDTIQVDTRYGRKVNVAKYILMEDMGGKNNGVSGKRI